MPVGYGVHSHLVYILHGVLAYTYSSVCKSCPSFDTGMSEANASLSGKRMGSTSGLLHRGLLLSILNHSSKGSGSG
jgi:hypothetical protein